MENLNYFFLLFKDGSFRTMVLPVSDAMSIDEYVKEFNEKLIVREFRIVTKDGIIIGSKDGHEIIDLDNRSNCQ